MDDADENIALGGYINGNIACVAFGCTTVTFGGRLGALGGVNMPDLGVSGLLGEARLSSRIESSLLSISLCTRKELLSTSDLFKLSEVVGEKHRPESFLLCSGDLCPGDL